MWFLSVNPRILGWGHAAVGVVFVGEGLVLADVGRCLCVNCVFMCARQVSRGEYGVIALGCSVV